MGMLVVPDVEHSERYRGCRTERGYAKRGHLCRADAVRAMKRLQTQTGTKGLNVYRCNQCELWHVGHKGQP